MKKFFIFLFFLTITFAPVYSEEAGPEEVGEIPAYCDAEFNGSAAMEAETPAGSFTTTNSQIQGLSAAATYHLTGSMQSTLNACTVKLLPADSPLRNSMKECPNAPSEEECRAKMLLTDDRVATGGVVSKWDKDAFDKSSTGASLMGLAYRLEKNYEYSPTPINMASYFNYYGSKLPFIGDEVMAASNYEQAWLTDPLFSSWKAIRNLAFGLIAVFMLYMGIAIITRNKVDQQTVVNIQYALPKIIISILLVAFSFPIGAALTSFAFTLSKSGDVIITSLMGNSGNLLEQGFEGVGLISGIGLVAMGLGVTMSVMTPILSVFGPLLGLIAVVLIFLHLAIWMNIYITVIKMVVATLTAPLEFAIYALPGQDTRLKTWFMKMSAYTISIFALATIPKLIHTVGWNFMMYGVISGDNPLGTIGMAALFMPWLIWIFGYSYALQLPAKIEAAFSGKKK